MAFTDDTVVVNVDPRLSRREFVQFLRERGSPAAEEAAPSYDVVEAQRVDPAFALAIFQEESHFATDPDSVTVQFDTHGPGSTRTSRTGRGETINTPRGPFVRYDSWRDGWQDLAFRLVDPSFVYVQEGRRTVRQIIERFAPPSDGNPTERYVQRVVRFLNDRAQNGLTDEHHEDPIHPVGGITFGRVPLPPIRDRIIHNKPENVGWDDRGLRRGQIVGTCVHMMEGNLMGTDGFFRNPAVGALTDYGIGNVHEDGAEVDGVIFMWNDPEGNRSPWASGWGEEGPGIEGDGQAFIDAYGIPAINKRLVSIELSGFFGARQTPVSAKQFESLCQLIAFWHDRARVPWDTFPVNPATGVVTQMQHFEFAKKGCPGAIVREMTSEYQARVKEIMRQHQEG